MFFSYQAALQLSIKGIMSALLEAFLSRKENSEISLNFSIGLWMIAWG